MDTNEFGSGHKEGELIVVEEHGYRELYRVFHYKGKWCAKAFKDGKVHELDVLKRLYVVKSIKKESIDEQF